MKKSLEQGFNLLIEKSTKPKSILIPKRVDSVMKQLVRFEVENPRMRNIQRELGEFLYFLTIETSAKNIVELGTSNGYSTLWLALAVKNNSGKVITIENQEWKIKLAQQNIAEAGLIGVVTPFLGDAQNIIKEINEPQFDFLFMDIWPGDYLACIKELRPKMKEGSFIVCDNLLTHRSRDGSITARGTEGDDYLQFATENFSASSTILNIGSGVHIGLLI